MYRTLDPERILETVRRLRERIAARFPEAGLGRVCEELIEVAASARERAEAIARPNLLLRISAALLIGLGLFAVWELAGIIDVKRDTENLFGVMQGIEAFLNTLVVVGAGIFSLVTLEDRIKRRRALADLHGLRSIVHVIDMHQLTKDPSTSVGVGKATAASPKRVLSDYELVRYLDYCSEMLSITAKVAALYAQALRDPVVGAAVNELEQLTSNLSQKIWQKIMILQDRRAPEVGADGKPLAATPATPAAEPPAA